VAIPPFNEHGWLPDGIHDCTLEEAAGQFGVFQSSDRRPELWARFVEFVREVKACGLVDAVLVDGSFVTVEPAPNDIDLILVVSSDHDFSADMLPSEYNVLSKRRVNQRFGFDIVLARANTDEVTETVDFFRQVRSQPHLRKGLLRIRL
jgi:hypothetical protein